MYKIKTIITEKEILDFYFANQKKEKREEEKVTEGDKHVQHFNTKVLDFLRGDTWIICTSFDKYNDYRWHLPPTDICWKGKQHEPR